jgi:hypothetical protein
LRCKRDWRHMRRVGDWLLCSIPSGSAVVGRWAVHGSTYLSLQCPAGRHPGSSGLLDRPRVLISAYPVTTGSCWAPPTSHPHGPCRDRDWGLQLHAGTGDRTWETLGAGDWGLTAFSNTSDQRRANPPPPSPEHSGRGRGRGAQVEQGTPKADRWG